MANEGGLIEGACCACAGESELNGSMIGGLCGMQEQIVRRAGADCAGRTKSELKDSTG